MSGYFRRLINAIKVYEKGDLVHVEGIATEPLLQAFHKVWNTSKIENYMFTRIENFSFSFNKFFVPDMIYCLNLMLQSNTRGLPVRAVIKTVELLKQETWFKCAYTTHGRIYNREKLANMVFKPLEHQEEFFTVSETNILRFQLKGYLAAIGAGGGKTFVALAIGEMLESDVNIIIVPLNSVDLVWKKSCETLYHKPYPYWVSTMSGEPPEGCRTYVFHYERLGQAVAWARKHQFKKPIIWVDESHNLNEMDTLRNNLFLELVEAVPNAMVYWASGTPIKAMGRETIPLLKSMDPHFNADAQERFTQIFGKSSSRALDILNNRIAMVMHKVDKKEFSTIPVLTREIKVKIPNGDKYTLEKVTIVLKEFIKERQEYYTKNRKHFVDIYEAAVKYFEGTLKSDLHKEELAKYRRYIKIISAGYDPKLHKEEAKFCNIYELKVISKVLAPHVRDEFRNARTVVKYVQLKILGEALGRVLGRLREECTVAMIPYIGLSDLIDDAAKKTVIFSTSVGAIKAASALLAKEGYMPLLVFGDTNKDLPAIITKFEQDEDVNPLCATYASLSTAVPLVMANEVITLNVPFRDYILTQAIARVDRIGQDTQVRVWKAFLDTGKQPNLSTRASDILEYCKEQVEQILGVKADLEAGDSVSMETFRDTEYHNTHDLDSGDTAKPKPTWASW